MDINIKAYIRARIRISDPLNSVIELYRESLVALVDWLPATRKGRSAPLVGYVQPNNRATISLVDNDGEMR